MKVTETSEKPIVQSTLKFNLLFFSITTIATNISPTTIVYYMLDAIQSALNI